MHTEFKAITALKNASFDLNSDINNSSLKLINRIFRENDESHFYPIYGAFNATDKAIRWYSRVYFKANGPCSNYEYILGLENKISEIVNKF